MGRYNLKPSRVHQTAAHLLETHSIKAPPPWFKTIGSIPPSEILTRTQPIEHSISGRPRTKKASKMFKPRPIVYQEDKLRQNFFADHPWELARPRIVLEQEGRDGQRCDWSKIQQRGRQLNGESVVQRQLWLLENVDGMTSEKAYDQARKEFYALRHEEEVERRVAREEALSTGATFGKSVLEIGMELEDKEYDSWKEWATQEIVIINQQRDAAYTGLPSNEEAVVGSSEPVVEEGEGEGEEAPEA